MIKKGFFICTCMLLLTSCSPKLYDVYHADANMRKIRIGMTESEVVAIMGKSYAVIAHTEKEYTLGYKAYDEGIYHLRFVNNRLKSWKKSSLIIHGSTTRKEQNRPVRLLSGKPQAIAERKPTWILTEELCFPEPIAKHKKYY